MCGSLDCCSQTEYLLVVLEFSSITDASLSSFCFFLHKWYYHASLETFKLLSLLISIVGFMRNILSSTLVIAIDDDFSILVPLWFMGQFGQIQKLSCFLPIIWWGILFVFNYSVYFLKKCLKRFGEAKDKGAFSQRQMFFPGTWEVLAKKDHITPGLRFPG